MSLNIIFRRQFSISNVGLAGKFSKFVVSATPKEHVVKPLVKPIGLIEPPSPTTKYSFGNSFKDLFDQDKTDRRSAELGIEFNKTSMYDMSIFQKTNGRIFEPPKSYWRADKALYFPHITGQSLSDSNRGNTNIEEILKGKISIVKIFGNRAGGELADSSFVNETKNIDYLNKDFEKLPEGVQIVQLNLIESKIKMFIFKLFAMGSLRKIIPKYLQNRYFICNRDQLPFMVRENLQINNIYTGYTILVDSNLKIRWMSSGAIDDAEFETLWKSVNGIKKETK